MAWLMLDVVWGGQVCLASQNPVVTWCGVLCDPSDALKDQWSNPDTWLDYDHFGSGHTLVLFQFDLFPRLLCLSLGSGTSDNGWARWGYTDTRWRLVDLSRGTMHSLSSNLWRKWRGVQIWERKNNRGQLKNISNHIIISIIISNIFNNSNN